MAVYIQQTILWMKSYTEKNYVNTPVIWFSSDIPTPEFNDQRKTMC